jgi:hypothetical protein
MFECSLALWEPSEQAISNFKMASNVAIERLLDEHPGKKVTRDVIETFIDIWRKGSPLTAYRCVTLGPVTA